MAIRKITTCIFSALTAATLGLAGTSSASACEAACQYVRVITYVCETRPYEICIVRYDRCGQPYPTHVTRYREVQVPVVKWVKVGH